ncbi:hypothetical protein ACGFZU_42310 [Streptomyces tendae]|uniref:hypothetical protein n=1 Tax=Streptomyces tendae TaxID=1932 RepID=UPI003720C425
MLRLWEEHSALLAGAVVGTHDTWIRRQVQLGSHYMADFVIAGQASPEFDGRWSNSRARSVA